MKPEDRRRIGAVAALVVGIFLGLALIPAVPTGPVGRALGDLLWRWLGVGAVGLPLLGAGLALAGFDRLPRLDMKRVTLLMVGLSLLIPFLIGVMTSSRPADFDPMLAEWTVPARATGLVPGLLAFGVRQLIGQPGGVLLGLLALSALTIVTYGWHPFQRLEKRAAVALPAEPKAKKRAEVAPEEEDEPEEEPPPLVPREGRKPDLKLIKTAKLPAPSGPASQPRNVDSELPPVTLLNSPPKQDTTADEAQLDKLGQSLLDTLRTFKVEGSISGRTSGPVVTQFEVVPAPGVKAGRIIALSDDLAITMRAMSIRVAPIPGRGAVGVEVPNPTPRIVTLRELLESSEWERSRATLPVALGRDLEGKPVVTDLAKNPHLLIAGATGTGKSVAINAIISCLVYKYTAKELRLLMVDPKMVELSLYNALPHLRHKVITNNNDAARV
ncbi:MAG: DNA translocase FtsK, partial [Gemmatimonadota bacterium]